MEDPVTVLGIQMTDVGRMWLYPDFIQEVTSHLTYVKIPGTQRYILNIDRPGHPEMNVCCTWHHGLTLLYNPKDTFAPMDLPRPVVLEYIRACTELLQKKLAANSHYKESICLEIQALDTWRFALILEGLRKRQAVRAIQRQFREAVANPEYAMCKKRLLREFHELRSNP